MPPLELLSEFVLDLNTTVIIDRESPTKVVNLNESEPESSLNLVAFLTNICFQMYLFIDHFEIKNKSLNKQVLHDALSCSVVVYSDPYSFLVLRYDPQCSGWDPLLCQCSVYNPLLRVHWSAFY